MPPLPSDADLRRLVHFSAGDGRIWLSGQRMVLVHAAAPLQPPLPDLDDGEAACIRNALAHVRERSRPALLLMDERAGRAIAVEHGLRVAGTAAVIGMARSRGLIGSAREVFAMLHACDFRISAVVIETVLRQVGE